MMQFRARDWIPWIAAGLYGALLAIPATRGFAFRLQDENGPVEWATVILLAAAAAAAAIAARSPATRRDRLLLIAGAAIFLFVCGEELAWGQHITGKPFSEQWAAANRQQETTLHNLGFMQGKSEIWYLVPAAVGLIAIRLAGLRRWLGAAAVDAALAPGLSLVALYALAELSAAFLPGGRLAAVQAGLPPMGEFIELVIGWLALQWAWTARARTASRRTG